MAAKGSFGDFTCEVSLRDTSLGVRWCWELMRRGRVEFGGFSPTQEDGVLAAKDAALNK